MGGIEDGRSRDEHHDDCCEAVATGEIPWICTRPPLHFGDHAAWADEELVASWSR